jgi:hypothetical protein
MKDKTVTVRHGKENGKQKTVATITVPIYESVSEAVEVLGESVALDMINKANVIRLQGIERNKYTDSGVGKKARQTMAFDLLTTSEIQQYTGNFAGLQAFLESPEMQARVDTKIAADKAGLV